MSSKRLLRSAAEEAKDLLFLIKENEGWNFELFFEDVSVPDGVDEQEFMEQLKIEYNKLKDKRVEFESNQIYSIFQKEPYPCNRFEIGNNYNKLVYICNSTKSLKELINDFREDKNSLLYKYFRDFLSPRVIVHGKDYDRTYIYYYKEKEEENNKYNLDLYDMERKVRKIASQYGRDGYTLLNLKDS